MYAPAGIGGRTEENGVSVHSVLPDAVPYLTWRIKNPLRSLSHIDRVRITRIADGESLVYDWSYSSGSDCWSLSTGSGAERKTSLRQKTEHGDAPAGGISLEVTDDIRDSGRSLVSRRLERYTRFSFGEMLTESIRDPDGLAETTETEYYSTGTSASAVRSRRHPSGQWEHVAYDSARRPVRRNTAFGNTGYSEDADAGLSLEYGYGNDTDDRPRSLTRKAGGVVTGKTFHAYSTSGNLRTEIIEVTTEASAQAGAVSNLKTLRVYDIRTERPVSVTRPDGTLETYTYEYGNYTPGADSPGVFVPDESGLALRETVVFGTVDFPGGIAGKTTRRITVTDSHGDKVLEEVHALLESGYMRAGYTVCTYGAMHRLLRSFSSGSRELTQDWLGGDLASSQDADGTEHVYSYDSAGRLMSVTKKGAGGSADIVTTYTYDAADYRLGETVAVGAR